MTRYIQIEVLTAYFGDERMAHLKQIYTLADHVDLPIFLVGGSVRDFLLARPFTDLDLVVEGDAHRFAKHLTASFGGSIETHASFYTATWIQAEGEAIDIASCRRERYPHPGSLPKVTFASLQEDLVRRDFTINALAIRLNEARFGEMIDLYGGYQDLHTKTIQVLHQDSFRDDPTRIFRAVRFSLRLQFEIDPNTVTCAQNVGGALHMISAERLRAELDCLFTEQALYEGSRMLNDLNIWQTLFGRSPYQHAWHHASCLNDANLLQPFNLLLALGNDALNDKYALTKAEKKRLREWISTPWKAAACATTHGKRHTLLASVSDESIVFAAYSFSHHRRDPLLSYVERRNTVKRAPLLSGRDLHDLGYTPGPHFSRWLFALTCAQLDDTVTTKKEAIEWLQRYISQT